MLSSTSTTVTHNLQQVNRVYFRRDNGLHIEIVGIPDSNSFIQKNLKLISPEFRLSQCHAIAFLQEVSEQLTSNNSYTKFLKNKCRDDFIVWGVDCIRALQSLGIGDSNLIDPRTGKVLFGDEGKLIVDSIPLFQQKLGFHIESHGTCKVALHPKWGTAYYPGILLTAAQPQLVISVIKHILPNIETNSQLVSE